MFYASMHPNEAGKWNLSYISEEGAELTCKMFTTGNLNILRVFKIFMYFDLLVHFWNIFLGYHQIYTQRFIYMHAHYNISSHEIL